MTCQHCCGAESFFDRKSANRDLRRYLKRGPNKTTLSLLSPLKDVAGKSLLDIGGGVGVIQHALLLKGAVQTTDVDASSSYIAIAREQMKTNKMEGKMTFIHGDFIDVHERLQRHHIVTLERVVCCYPDVDSLIKNSTAKSTEYYGLVYPMDNFFSKLMIKLMDVYMWILRNPFRSFVHDEEKMDKLIQDQGFNRIHYDRVFPWRIAVYKRSSS